MGVRIVIVDAEPVVRATMAAILENEGYEVIQTDDPMLVVEMIKSEPPALVITNASLSDITGHEAVQLFKQHSPNLPVLMISGLSDIDIIRKWRGEGGFGIFPKPFRAGDLRAKVREMLSLPRARVLGAY